MSSVIVSLLSSFDDKGIKDAEKAFSSLTGKVKSIGKSLAITAGSYLAGANAVDFVKQSADAAMQLERNMAGVKTIFGAATPEIKKYIDASEKLGMSHAAAAKATTFLGSVFKQTGMPMDQVVEKTKTMVSLGSDLAATYGYSVDEALTAMTATFRGEYDPIEKFGVAMKQQQVNAELAARGLKGLTGGALIAAQQQIRYEMILQRTTDAQGAFARSSGNLFQQQQILKAEFTDLQATLGRLLIPSLVKMAESLKPVIEKLGPKLAVVFTQIADMLVKIAPMLPQFGQMLVDAFGALGGILKTTGPLLQAIIYTIANHSAAVLGLIAGLKVAPTLVRNWSKIKDEITLAVYAMGYFRDATKGATVAQTIFNVVARANPYVLIATAAVGAAAAIADISVKMAGNFQKQADTKAEALRLNAALKKQGREYLDLSDISKQYQGIPRAGMMEAKAWESALEKLKAYKKAFDTEKLMLSQLPSAKQVAAHKGQTAVDAALGNTDTTKSNVKTWFQTLREEMTKQADRMKLGKLGLSKVLIDSLLSASDWQSAVAKVMGMTKSQIKKLIADFSKTSAAQDAAAADLAERTSKFVDAVKARIDTVKSLTDGLASFMPRTLADVTTQVGQFEGDVVSAAETLRGSLKDALDSKSISQAAYDQLSAYANREIKVMQDLAAQRDRVAAKIEAAKGIYLEVAQAVRGYGNITSTTTAQVTESYKKIIDGVEVTVSRTVDAIQNKDLVASYKQVVDKTKAFLANLQQLKKMGLNQTLFKQIVDAGVDAGNATAEAIVQGGGDTVSSLNDLFGQLDATGAQMADLTAQVMEDSGIKIVSGFIDGLTAQEADLADKAKSMAKTFSDAFNNNVRFVVPTVKPSDYGLTTDQANAALKGAGVDTGQGGAGANDFGITVGKGMELATKGIADAAYVAKGELDRVERAAAGIGALASVNTTAATGTPVTAADLEWQARIRALAASPNSTYNVTVNAGMGTDGTTVGQTIVQLLKQYERNNGAVWTAAS